MTEQSSDHPYWGFLDRVEKPARYLGGEYLSVVKPEARIRMCLAFPDVYDIGMSHLGTKILYQIVNADPDLALERAFCPWFDMEAELRARGLPLLSLETARPLSDFDVVGFSLQYEMTYTNILTMLELGGIPLRTEARSPDHPLVIAGGPAATHPEPVAPFFDAILVGDAEEALPELLHRTAELKAAGASRDEQLVALSEVDGVYVPSLYDTAVDPRSDLLVVSRPRVPGVKARVERAFVEDVNRFPFPTDSPEPVAEAIFDRVSIEIARGCTEGCRFCQAGMIYRPVRERSPEAVLETISKSLATGGYDEVSLTSLSTADYSCISPLIKRAMARLRPDNVSLSVSSLRAYGLDEDLLDEMASVRATGLTFAPEAGTQRMRDVVNKNITEEDIFSTCHRVFSRGWKRVKLYFMIGLPTETDEDVLGIAEMGAQALDIGRQYQPRGGIDVTVSVSSHVPKPHTPFQWCAMDPIADIERKQVLLLDAARRLGFGFRRHDMRVSHLEGILARGDRRTADLIELAWHHGARFDGWDEHLDWDAWRTALAEWEAGTGVDRHQFLGTLPLDGRLPWDHIDVGLAEGFLAREYKRALAGRLSPPCGKPFGAKVHHTNVQDAVADQRTLICYHCGVACDLTQMRSERIDFLERLGAKAPPAPDTAPRQTERERAHRRFRRGMAPRTIDRGHDARYRIRYTKLGQVALTGHLDVVRMLPRIFKRAGIQLCYSQGFHPKPLVSYSPALGLGIRSVAEYADIRLVERIPSEELVERLSRFAPAGLRILGAAELGPNDRKLSRVLNAQDYLLMCPHDWLARQLGELHRDRNDELAGWRATLAARCTEALAQPELMIRRLHKGRERLFDGRPSLLALEICPDIHWPAALRRAPRAGPSGDAGTGQAGARLGLLLRLALTQDTAVPKPSELIDAIFGDCPGHGHFARVAMWCVDGPALVEPLDLIAENAPAAAEPASPLASP